MAAVSNTRINKSTRLEDALSELETIVNSLEQGEQPLDQSLKQYERGVALARFCQDSLDQAEQRVRQLTEDADGNEQLEPFAESPVVGQGKN